MVPQPSSLPAGPAPNSVDTCHSSAGVSPSRRVSTPFRTGHEQKASLLLKMEAGLLLDPRAYPHFSALLSVLTLLFDSGSTRLTHWKAKAASVSFLDFFPRGNQVSLSGPGWP